MMTFLNLRSHLLFLSLLSFVDLNVSFAFKFSTRARESLREDAGHHTALNDWKDLARSLPDDQTGTYSQALQLLNSMQKSPSCNRLAASTLLESCQTVDGSSHDVEETLEDIKSVYAARLALCEISATGLEIPSDCKLLMPWDDQEGQGSLGWILGSGRAKLFAHDNIGHHQLSQCLRSLETRPQWWTSYSNSRQNAVVMCQAARVDIERDEFIKLHKSMAEASSHMKDALSRALDKASSRLSEQEGFAVTVQGFQRRVLQDFESSSLQAQSYFTKLMDRMETAMQLMLGKWNLSAKDFGVELNEMRNSVQKSNSEASSAEINLRNVFQQVQQGSSELVASQIKQRDFTRELGVELQRSLEDLKLLDLQTLLSVSTEIHSQVHASNELISLMHFREKILDERLETLVQSFTDLETKTGTFYTAQNAQLSVQNLLHEQVQEMQNEMQVARRILSNITSSASALQSAIETSSTQIAQMATFSGLTSAILQWGWLVLGLVVLFQFNTRYAGYLATGLGFIILVRSSGIPSLFEKIPADMVLIHYASGYQIPILVLLKVALVTMSILSMVVFLYRLQHYLPATKSSKNPFPFHLRFLAMNFVREIHQVDD